MPATQFFGKVRHTVSLDGKTFAAGATVVVPDFISFQALCVHGAIDDLAKGIATVGQLPKDVSPFSSLEGHQGDQIGVQHIIKGS